MAIEPQQQRLEQTAADLAGESFDRKMRPALTLADQAIPGAAEKLAPSVAEFRAAVTKEREAEVKGLVDEGTETSLRKALEIVAAMRKELDDPGLSAPRDLFSKYGFKFAGRSAVQFTLPKGASYADLYSDCHAYCTENWNTDKRLVAIRETALKQAAAYAPSEKPVTETVWVATDLTNMTRAQQEEGLAKRNLSMASLEATKAAAALYYCYVGQDLFSGLWVRTAERGVILGPTDDGLCMLLDDCDSIPKGNIASAGSPVPRN